MRKVIVISAHPDDETLGAGGTLLKHQVNGDEIYWLIVTNILEEYGFGKERVQLRQQEISKVSSLYQFKDTFKLDYPTMHLSDYDLKDLIPKISNIFHAVQPEVVYLMNRSDAHSDHRIVFNAVMACTKSFRYPFVKQVMMYECISETEFAPALHENVFIPNYFVDITEQIDLKIQIMEVFESELEQHPFPRSLNNIRSLAHLRGASVGVDYAEAFQLIKYIDK